MNCYYLTSLVQMMISFYKDLEHEVDKKLLMRAMTTLTEREKMIIELRFGINQKEGEEKTQKEVADLLGISRVLYFKT